MGLIQICELFTSGYTHSLSIFEAWMRNTEDSYKRIILLPAFTGKITSKITGFGASYHPETLSAGLFLMIFS